MYINIKLFIIIIFYCISIFYNVKITTARELTPTELDSVKKETIFVFKNFLQLWQEERYFELYKFGGEKTFEKISLEEFATRMVELDWVPVGLESLKEPKISFRYKTLVYVSAEIVFQHKSQHILLQLA